MSNLSIVQKNGKFIVTKNGQLILLPKSDGQSIITEFSSREDAERYLGILSTLSNQKKYQKS